MNSLEPLYRALEVFPSSLHRPTVRFSIGGQGGKDGGIYVHLGIIPLYNFKRFILDCLGRFLLPQIRKHFAIKDISIWIAGGSHSLQLK